MTLSALIKNIYSVYSISHTDLEQRNFNHEISGIASTVTNAKDVAANSDMATKIDTTTRKGIVDNFDSILESLDSQLFPQIDTRDECLSTLTTTYIGAVSAFTNEGGTGFYDFCTILSGQYENDAAKIEAAICKLQENNFDVRLCEKITNENATSGRLNTFAKYAIVFPTSIIKEVYEAFAPITENNDYSVNIVNYFIAPKLNSIQSDPIEFIKETAHKMRSSKDSHYRPNDICLDAITSIGLLRNQTTWYDQFNIRETITEIIARPSIYSKPNDHVSGAMATRHCYNKKEVRDYHISTNSTRQKIRNIIDEITVYETNNAALGHDPIA
jgi:hypothetical protein